MEEYIGVIKLFAGNFAPRGFMYCAGQILSISSNTALFSILGTTYGGDGRTTFALPDLRDRVPVGAGMGSSPVGLNAQLGQAAGEVNHTLIMNEMPQHNHSLVVNSGNATQPNPLNNSVIASPGTSDGRNFNATLGFNTNGGDTPLNQSSIGVTGGSQPHNNMQPYLGLGYIICTEGIFPSRP